MKICTTCVLPESFPGIAFDEEGRCSYCRRYRGRDNQEKLKERFKQKFLTILEETKNKGPHDALMAYSGGKDSTYTLRLLKEVFGLRVLAITFDHGFVSPIAMENIRNVTNILNINLLTIRPGASILRSIFVKSMAQDIYPIKALERASSICNSCMNLVKSFLIRNAIDMGVPIVAYGWSPGQAPIQSSVFKTNPSMVHQTQKAMVRVFDDEIRRNLSAFFLEEHHFERDSSSQSYKFPYIVHPLAFLDYDEEHILSTIQELGWVNPTDTDANSSNCLLNGFANEVHIKQYRFHPYAFEIAGLVREGYMTREEGLKKLSIPPDPKVIDYVRRKLGVDNVI
ncbi:MAG: hypothetical protein JSW15_03780 [Deltaproteobacteria bacterium]|nr:MAG: hypothetical protein JSW15_03780 [Deltaproteobacteria bacterium]